MMTISSISGSGNTYSSSSASDIASLEKQLTKLLKELKEVVLSDDDEETKKLKTQMLQQQIQMIQNQIVQKKNQIAAEEKAKEELQDQEKNVNILGVNVAAKAGSIDISI
ncbi:hypothetical protein D3C73_1474520 [compost metagenome]